MYHQQSCAARGAAYNYGRRSHPYSISAQRAPVNVYKAENSYIMLVFAPGRVKENFQIQMKGNELTISYTPVSGTITPDWIRKEYSRGAFERTFTLDETIDGSAISAKYTDGVLEIGLPIIPGKEAPEKNIAVS